MIRAARMWVVVVGVLATWLLLSADVQVSALEIEGVAVPAADAVDDSGPLPALRISVGSDCGE